MGERKVLNKYYPPDFDPSKLPRNKRPRDELEQVRFMLPMTVRCSTCGDYMYAGTKFNTKKEPILNEDYLGMRIFRFYLKCTSCSAPFTIKTDPKNADYQCETGATRNFEPWRQKDANAEENGDPSSAAGEPAGAAEGGDDEEDDVDAMTALENKTLDAREQMEALDALDELKSLRSRQAKVGLTNLFRVARRHAGKEEEERRAQDAKDATAARVAFEEKRRRQQGEETGAVEPPQERITSGKGKDLAPTRRNPIVAVKVKVRQAQTAPRDGLAGLNEYSGDVSSSSESSQGT